MYKYIYFYIGNYLNFFLVLSIKLHNLLVLFKFILIWAENLVVTIYVISILKVYKRKEGK